MIQSRLSIKNFLTFSICLLPAAMVSGPFISDLIISFCALYMIYLIITKKFIIKKFNLKIFSLYIFFCIYLILLSLFSNFNDSLVPSLFYFRFGLFAILIIFLLEEKKNFFKYFLIGALSIVLIVSIDGIYQYLFDENIIGFKKIRNDRLTGLFFDEMILGSFLQKISPFLFLFFTIKNLNQKIRILTIIVLILSYITIILSGERMAFLLIHLFFFLYLFKTVSLKKFFLIHFVLTAVIGIVLIFNSNLNERFLKQTLFHLGINNKIITGQEKISEKLTLFSTTEMVGFLPTHSHHLKTGFNIFLSRPIFGYGLKSFRHLCGNKKYTSYQTLINKGQHIETFYPPYIPSNDPPFSYAEIKNTQHIYKVGGCSTHPHNSYVQLLAETGLIGFLLISFFFIYIFFIIFISKNRKNLSKKTIIPGLMLIMNLFPLAFTVSFFNNWLSIVYYLPIGFFIHFYLLDRKNFNGFPNP